MVTATPARPKSDAEDLPAADGLPSAPAHHRDCEHEHRRSRIEHAGEAAGDMRLAPADQGERQRALQQALHEERSPHRSPAGKGVSLRASDQEQENGRDGHPRRDHRDGRNRGDRDLDQRERAAPDQRQQQQEPDLECERGLS
ncbi:hypothetical protein ABIF36_001123 [Bradyrhizobium japonicum]